MKFSIIKNDKSTFWDEVILGLISFGCIAIGVLLIVFKPSLGIIDSNSLVVMGAMITLWGFMFLPCLIYRLNEGKIAYPTRYNYTDYLSEEHYVSRETVYEKK